jgi:hypothetical protein
LLLNVTQNRRGNHEWTIQIGNIEYTRRRKTEQKIQDRKLKGLATRTHQKPGVNSDIQSSPLTGLAMKEERKKST